MTKQKRDEIYGIINNLIVKRSFPIKVITRKEVFFVLGAFFHIPKELREIYFKRLIEYGYLEEVCKGNFKVVGCV